MTMLRRGHLIPRLRPPEPGPRRPRSPQRGRVFGFRRLWRWVRGGGRPSTRPHRRARRPARSTLLLPSVPVAPVRLLSYGRLPTVFVPANIARRTARAVLLLFPSSSSTPGFCPALIVTRPSRARPLQKKLPPATGSASVRPTRHPQPLHGSCFFRPDFQGPGQKVPCSGVPSRARVSPTQYGLDRNS